MSKAAARRIALAAQGFADRPPGGTPTARHFRRAYDRMGVLQIDSVNVLTRAHYLPVFARLGTYDRGALDALEYPKRAVFEYWAHMASYSPIEHHPLLRWRMEAARERSWKLIEDGVRGRQSYVEDVRAMVVERGPLTASQIAPDRPGKERGQMWSWHDGKVAIEYLFRTGEVSSVRRNSQFERVYDLTERVIPQPILAQPTPDIAGAQRELLAIAARAHGIGTTRDLKDYFRLRGKVADQALRDLVEDGVLVPATVRGSEQKWWLHRDARRPRAIPGDALLSPFDPVIWERSRTDQLWDTHYRIEIYTPKHKRVHGYYVLMFLLDEQLAARVDLKADRRAGALLVQGASLEQTTTHPEGYVAERLAARLGAMAAWLGLDGVRVEAQSPFARVLAGSRVSP
ncbi:winged helix-turn-helix domain-containing protein [Epidermidibacterium keratini]|uniref:Winged helix-turn-helix domain-containing protein n=2 Tax=Epidermidibacterium keratini TaxID=1891644 RepID=A0A7L4YUR2_9ACTN|nr:winged helix-turn-helix domain-containing protein [Epidermidibacterium keratini]